MNTESNTIQISNSKKLKNFFKGLLVTHLWPVFSIALGLFLASTELTSLRTKFGGIKNVFRLCAVLAAIIVPAALGVWGGLMTELSILQKVAIYEGAILLIAAFSKVIVPKISIGDRLKFKLQLLSMPVSVAAIAFLLF